MWQQQIRSRTAKTTGNIKIHEFLYYSYIHFQSVKTYNNWTVHEYKCLFLTFAFLQIERERESGTQNLGIKENGPRVT